jgi:hypothetical protein
MHLRTLLTAAFVLTLATTGARAQSYTLKIKEFPAPGKSITVTSTGKTNSSFKIALGGMVLKEDKKTEIEESEYVEKVLAAGSGPRPQKYSRAYTKATRGEAGTPVKLFQHGKTILFESQGDKYQATVDGDMPKDEEGKKALESLARSASKASFEAMLPKEAVPVGGTWTVPGKLVLDNLPEFKDTDPAAIKAQGKLLKAYKKDGQQWGTVELIIDLPLKNLGEGPVLNKAIPMQLKATIDAAIDGSSTAGTMTGLVTVKGSTDFTQNNMTFALDLAMDGEFRTQRSAEK